MIGFAQSALNQTEVEIRIACLEYDIDMVFQVQYVLRSSPCDKEFFDAKRADNLRKLLAFYFDDLDHIPDTYDYDKIVLYKSNPLNYSCKNFHGSIIVNEPQIYSMIIRNVSSLINFIFSSWHPAQIVPADGIYFLVIKVVGIAYPSNSVTDEHNVTVTVKWKQPHGYLSAIDFPLLRFYILMCIFYATLAFVWVILCIKYYKDILRIQYWIGAVIFLGMIEKAFFLAEYSTMNNSGHSVEGILELAELVSCAKRTMSRVLVIIVSVGYGVVKPRLGNTLSQVAGVGFVYFVFCAIEGLARVSKNHVEAAKQKQFAALPLVITEIVIFYWIFTSLSSTMRTLKLRRNEVKLTVYRHFMNTLVFAVIASVIFMIWSLVYHIFPVCLKDWKELQDWRNLFEFCIKSGWWVDTAFWHVLFCFILVVIVILWRPSVNNQRYAFTPLLDDSEDENDQDEIFNASSVPGFEMLKQRESGNGAEIRRQKEKEREDHRIQDDLQWIDDHIPSSLAEHLLVDDDEDKEARDSTRNQEHLQRILEIVPTNAQHNTHEWAVTSRVAQLAGVAFLRHSADRRHGGLSDAFCGVQTKAEVPNDDDAYMDQDIVLTNFTGSSPCKMASKRALELVVLNNANISYLGDVSEISSLLQHVAEADLAWNRIQWDCVKALLTHLPQLRTLNLSHNPLDGEIVVDLPSAPLLHTLILNGTNLKLGSLSSVLKNTPSLQELHLSDNKLDLSTHDISIMNESVKTMHLNRCQVKHWDVVVNFLHRFPSLETVFLCENPIKSVVHQSSLEEFTSLQSVNLGKTEISDWESIDSLDRLPSLTDLRILAIPLLESYDEDERIHLVVARIRNLRVLNGSIITPEQREQSERYFIRYYQERDDKPHHYFRLIEKHGNVEKLAKVDLTPKSSAQVQVFCEESNYQAKLRINLNKSVGQLMKSLEKQCGIPYSRLRMFLTTKDGWVEEFRYHGMSLHSYRIEDGDILNLQSKIVSSRRRPIHKSGS
ncbi:leucine Rich repeat-containing domain protein [Dictyocaulus viviparus]|uniref:Leucine Rich repeat-containing domain protein n=1 Tax=Dictyocaulus viviparus TaxID=29172 RepID=A0A0D8XQJ0_DICVI|nr:leucine Rich repeat-containing domain protein [Dictyocaulus viviparus]